MKNPRLHIWKDIIKNRRGGAEINEKETKEPIAKSTNLKAGSFEINKIDKPLARLIKEKNKGGGEDSNQQN